MSAALTRCNGCGRTDRPTQAFRCVWPDGCVTLDRHCGECEFIWHAQLRGLGARIEALAPLAPAAPAAPAVSPTRRPERLVEQRL